MDAVPRFWSYVRKGRGCWEWQGGFHHAGYGTVRWDGRPRSAHRVAWTISRGEIPNGLHVCHHCDNKKCVRPSHLFVGTNGDNVRDALAKGRRRFMPDQRGEHNRNAKLTPDIVQAIRNSYGEGSSRETVARRFCISPQTVSDVSRGRSWAHIPGATPDAFRLRRARGENHPNAKMTERAVRRIRQLHEAGMTFQAIALRMRLSPTMTGLIARRIAWRHVA